MKSLIFICFNWSVQSNGNLDLRNRMISYVSFWQEWFSRMWIMKVNWFISYSTVLVSLFWLVSGSGIIWRPLHVFRPMVVSLFFLLVYCWLAIYEVVFAKYKQFLCPILEEGSEAQTPEPPAQSDIKSEIFKAATQQSEFIEKACPSPFLMSVGAYSG